MPAAWVLVEGALLVTVVTGATTVLPDRIAQVINRNSEALLIGAGTTFLVLLAHHLTRPQRVVTGWIIGVAFFGFGLLSLTVDNPRIVTLNEPLFAVAVLAVYLLVVRRRRVLAWLTPALLAAMAIGANTALVIDQAESLVALALMPIGVELVAPWLFEPDAPPTRRNLRTYWLWTAFVLLAPLGIAFLRSLGLPGFLGDLAHYGGRSYESFWGVALVFLAGWSMRHPRSPRRTDSAALDRAVG